MSQPIIDRSYVGDVLQHIYTSDLNVKITLFASGGYFYVADGDHNTPLHGTTIEEAVTDLSLRLVKEFPNSSFTHWWQSSFAAEKMPW